MEFPERPFLSTTVNGLTKFLRFSGTVVWYAFLTGCLLGTLD